MHEAAVAQSILNIVCTKLRQTPNAEEVLTVHIIVGEFRNVEIASLQFAFDNLKALFNGCHNCELEAKVVQSKAVCRTGGHTYHPDFEHSFQCITCGDGIGKLICGEELDIIGITLQSRIDEECNEHARVSR